MLGSCERCRTFDEVREVVCLESRELCPGCAAAEGAVAAPAQPHPESVTVWAFTLVSRVLFLVGLLIGTTAH